MLEQEDNIKPPVTQKEPNVIQVSPYVKHGKEKLLYFSFQKGEECAAVWAGVQVIRVLLIRTEKLGLHPTPGSPSLHPHSQYYKRQPDLYLAFSCNVLNLALQKKKKKKMVVEGLQSR